MKKLKKTLVSGTINAIGLMISMVSPVHAVKLAQAPTNVFGTIEAPEGVKQYNIEAGDGGFGLILFISNIIKLATVIAGIWVMINFILAGWDYIMGAGDSKSITSASDKMTNSMIGLLIIVSAYTIAGLIGIVFFGDASYIINPKIQGV